MKILWTLVVVSFYCCYCTVWTVNSETTYASSPGTLRKLLGGWIKRHNQKDLFESRSLEEYDQDSSELLKELRNNEYMSLSKKRNCPWCPYIHKIEPGTEDDFSKVGKVAHWTSYDKEKSRHRRNQR